jgi:hypothetical protein
VPNRYAGPNKYAGPNNYAAPNNYAGPTSDLSTDIDPVVFNLGTTDEPRLYELAPRVVTTAHPFSDEDLRAFLDAGEHTGSLE